MHTGIWYAIYWALKRWGNPPIRQDFEEDDLVMFIFTGLFTLNHPQITTAIKGFSEVSRYFLIPPLEEYRSWINPEGLVVVSEKLDALDEIDYDDVGIDGTLEDESVNCVKIAERLSAMATDIPVVVYDLLTWAGRIDRSGGYLYRSGKMVRFSQILRELLELLGVRFPHYDFFLPLDRGFPWRKYMIEL